MMHEVETCVNLVGGWRPSQHLLLQYSVVLYKELNVSLPVAQLKWNFTQRKESVEDDAKLKLNVKSFQN